MYLRTGTMLTCHHNALSAHMSQLLDTIEPGCTTGSTSIAHLSRRSYEEESQRPSPERHKAELTIRYMVEHLTERLNINQLASLVHVSPSYYFAMFKRQTSYAPIDFFIHLRMFRACIFLDRTPLTVKEIALALGYEDAFYFSRLFKSVNDVAPSDYRFLPSRLREGIRNSVLPHICHELGLSLDTLPVAGRRQLFGCSR
jgi:AraC-like DNA-binding protein